MFDTPLHVTRSERDGVAEIALAGDLDLASVSVLQSALDDALATRTRRVVVDASGLSYLDSSGINCLMRAADSAKRAGARVVVRNPAGIVATVLAITGVDGELLEAPGIS
jgi:anti-sigma B factor antagonist